MATIINRGKHQFQVIVRRKGEKSQTKTFETKAQAEAWARQVEAKIDSGEFRDRRLLKGITLGDALEKYRVEISPLKRAPTAEINRIKQLEQHPIAARHFVSLAASDFATYRQQRLADVSGTTVRLELAVLSHLYTIAIKEWNWPAEHVLKNVSRPRPNAARERRFEGDEFERLMAVVQRPGARSGLWLEACIRLSYGSGMRAGEILTLTWDQVSMEKGIIKLDQTQNGSKRTVGLTGDAWKTLATLPRTDNRVIPNFHDTSGLDRAFKRACKAASIENLRFHDIRHEVASINASLMEAVELAKTMGWKTLQMAMRYYNPTDDEMAALARRREPVA